MKSDYRITYWVRSKDHRYELLELITNQASMVIATKYAQETWLDNPWTRLLSITVEEIRQAA